mmetsp:Transcript_18601/g.28902  ORF Transcript_18601/g.28902 Transcript_18601/m.28902 type:complete len:219 (+) Transcript_18601:171-827(+)
MSPSSRPVSKAAAKRVTRSQSKCRSILISDKRLGQEAAYSEESVDSESMEECNWRDNYNSRKHNSEAQQWIARFQELKSYKAEHGHCNVPRSVEKLGRWVDTQRQRYRLLQEGKQSSTTDDRIQKLESIGFQWSLRRFQNKSAVQPAVLAVGAADMEPVSTSTPDDPHHRGTEASSNDHINNVGCQLDDSRDVSCDEPKAASKVDSEFRPFLLGGGYC